MNQDQLKSLLIALEEPEEEFSVIFSGKKSRKVDGLYYPDTAEIIIHNKNMEREDELVYTGIHEYAHHIIAGKSRTHSREFWAAFHRLLDKAEAAGLYANPLKTDSELTLVATRIRVEFLQEEGERMLEFGKLLMQAYEICRSRRYSFEDFVDRNLGLHRNIAKTLIRSYQEEIPGAFGYENMKSLLRIKDPDLRNEAARELEAGKSPDMVYHSFSPGNGTESRDEAETLRREEQRIERSLNRLNQRLDDIRKRLSSMNMD